MQRPSYGPLPSTGGSSLVRFGEHVKVWVIHTNVTIQTYTIAGTIEGTDAYGLLVAQEGAGSMFIPWSNISTVVKVAG